ncbi:MAG: hypothetical protein WAN86_14460 [Hyphomicrobiaceae bacterium]
MPTAKSTRLLFSLALLAAAPPLLADHAAADEVTLKCSFSLWNDRVEVGRGEWGGHYCDSGCRLSAGAIEKRLAGAQSHDFELTRVIDLDNAGRTEPNERHTITPRTIRILPVRKAIPLFAGRGLAAGYFRIDAVEIARIDLSAKAKFELFLGRAGGRASLPGGASFGCDSLGASPSSCQRDNSGHEDNIIASVTVKGSCTRVPKML